VNYIRHGGIMPYMLDELLAVPDAERPVLTADQACDTLERVRR